jgi:hypothetical protein
MEDPYLGSDAKETRDRLLDYVNTIVMRVDKGEPTAQMETF